MDEKKVLYLTLQRKWFDKILVGQKKEEYREDRNYWRKRLAGRRYDEIRFVNGHGRYRPFMRVECLGISLEPGCISRRLQWIIRLGKILEVGNV